jgi:predicted aspartyl protease
MKFQFDRRKGLIIVPVTIKGPKMIIDANFVLDTGASYTVINSELLLRAGFQKDDYIEKINTTTASGISGGTIMKINSLGALGLIRNNLKIISKELPLTLYVDGLLGIDFLRNKELNLNFRTGIISFE